jgi:uncharacterized protein with HEPN domain
MKDDKLYLIHIKECLDRVEKYATGGSEVFFSDEKTQDAILRNLQTMSESVKRVSDGLKNCHSEIDWRGIAGFRNVLVHDYLGINLDRVWEIIENDLKQLTTKIDGILKVLP